VGPVLACAIRRTLSFIMSELLLVVAETFVMRGEVVISRPRAPIDRLTAPRFVVRLRRPDGTERVAEAILADARVAEPERTAWFLRLPGLTVDEVPIGTEVWSEP
jgi:hypothetical protein